MKSSSPVTFGCPNIPRVGRAAFVSSRSYFFGGVVTEHFGRFGNYPDWVTLRAYFAAASKLAARWIKNNS